MDELDKEERIKKEIRRLNSIYTKISKKEKAVIDGLVKRAAYMRITLENMEEDLDANGFTESFSQSLQMDPYDRERPMARLYNTMNKNYQGIMKQLSDFVEKEPPKPMDDGFDGFVNSR